MIKKTIQIKNKKAYHDYTIVETYEAGISLLGSEVKSIRNGKANLSGGWVNITEGLEMQLENIHISQYDKASLENHDPKRRRKLLMHKKEIIKISNKTHNSHFTIVPLKIYETRSLIKIQIGLAKGKKNYDKRESDKKSTAAKEIAASMKKHNSN